MHHIVLSRQLKNGGIHEISFMSSNYSLTTMPNERCVKLEMHRESFAGGYTVFLFPPARAIEEFENPAFGSDCKFPVFDYFKVCVDGRDVIEIDDAKYYINEEQRRFIY